MKGDTFKGGDEVAVSATFLRSLGTENFGGHGNSGLSRYDPGIGIVLMNIPGIDCVEVWFPQVERAKTYNIVNLVHRRDINKEAHRAAQKPLVSYLL